MSGHLQDGVHRLLLRAFDKRARVDYDYVGIFGACGQFGATPGEQTHHDFAVDQILGTTQADEAHFLWARGLRSFWSILVRSRTSEILHRHTIFLF